LYASREDFQMSPSSLLAALVVAGGPAPQSPEPQLLDVDGTVFVMLGLFFIVMFVLTRWLWRPYLRVKEERVARVDGYRAEASRLESDAAERLARVEAELAEARRLGSAQRASARSEAHLREQKIVADAQAAAQQALAHARARLEAAFAAERDKLHTRASVLGAEITEKVLGRPVTS
jgi:F-type H+-transporting ATPase subunit b